MNIMTKPEILAPAGSMDALKAAVAAGADAVYLGGSKFGARAYADNFDEQQLIEGIEYCHLYGVKVYLTVNTLFRDDELQQLYDYLLPFYCAGLDAVIVQDLGVVAFVSEHFPGLAIHASTQMSVTTAYAYEWLQKYGVTRIVPARELSLEELRKLKLVNNAPELEVFVQGAICYCYSGHCLMSSFLGGRSGNRGRCAQPCRLTYQMSDASGKCINASEPYLLSPKDLCGLSHVKELMEVGIDSFKIEGRMKKPSYVAACVLAYRRVVDACMNHTLTDDLLKQCRKDMASVFNRGGFTDGYFKKNNGRDMMSMHDPGNAGVRIGKICSKNKNQIEVELCEDVHKGDLFLVNTQDEDVHLTCNVDAKSKRRIFLNTSNGKKITVNTPVYRMQDAFLESELKQLMMSDKKIFLTGSLRLQVGQPARLQLNYGQYQVCREGNAVDKASKQPITEKVVREKMMQLGNTKYQWKQLTIDLDDDAFFSMKELKELRREGIADLEQEILKSFCRNRVPVKETKSPVTQLSANDFIKSETPIVQISSVEQMEGLISYKKVKDIYIDLQYFQIEDIIHLWNVYSGYRYYIVLPPVFRIVMQEEFMDLLKRFSNNIKGIVVRNLDEFSYLKSIAYDGEIIADYSLYTMNRYALENYSWNRDTLPVELNEKELLRRVDDRNSGEWIVYGYQQLMISKQCICKNTYGCKKDNRWEHITDRYKKRFPVRMVCKYCYNLIYNNTPTVLFDVRTPLLQKKNLRHRLIFTIEDKQQTQAVLDCYFNHRKYEGEYTRGHFSRGVE